MCVTCVQVGDLGRGSIGGKGVRIDVRRGLRFQSPEAICSGTTSKVSPCPTGLQQAVALQQWLVVKTTVTAPTPTGGIPTAQAVNSLISK